MGRKKSKKRTHVVPAPDEAPKSFVVKTGTCSSSSLMLLHDFKKTLEPNTSTKLRVRKGNKLQDFVAVAAQLNVTHLILFSLAKSGVSMRIGRLVRGPTLSFKVKEYSLARDVIHLQKRPRSTPIDFQSAPLVVLNGFSGSDSIKLMGTMIQAMYPTIKVNKMRLNEARRVILYTYSPETDLIEFRHYSITVNTTGLSKSVKSLLRMDLPAGDVEEFMARGLMGSESDVEEGPESNIQLPLKHGVSQQKQVKLVELGPRLTLQLVKIQQGLCDGPVIHHSYITKTVDEVQNLEMRKKKEIEERKKRREEQERNIKAKREADGFEEEIEDAEGDEEEDEEEEDMDMDLDEVEDMDEEE